MANTSSVKGLMTLLGRDEWQEAFAEIQRAHVFVACHNAGVGTGEMTRKEARDLRAVYYSEVSRLTSEGWRSQAGPLHAAQPPPVKASTFPKGAHHGLCHR